MSFLGNNPRYSPQKDNCPEPKIYYFYLHQFFQTDPYYHTEKKPEQHQKDVPGLFLLRESE